MINTSSISKSALFCALFIYNLCHATDYCPPFDGMNIRVLFVNNSCEPPGDGTFETPYTDLQNALLNSTACDVIYVAPGSGPYDANSMAQITFQLLDNQRLLGTSTEAFQFCSNCPKPRLINTMMAQPIVNLRNNNEVSGFIIDATSVGQNPRGISMESIILEDALITNNDFITVSNSNAIVFGISPSPIILGTLQVSNCTFTGVAASYILAQASGDYNCVIDHNRLSGAAFIPINITTGDSSAASISILSNLIENTSDQPADGIFIQNGNFTGASLQLNIANNTVYINPMVNTMNLVAGINISNTAGSSLCLSMNQNSVRTPTNFPGYLLRNSASGGVFRLNEDANLGTIKTCITPSDVGLFPITVTESCP